MIDKLLITCLQRNKRLVLPGLGAFIRKSIDGVGVVLVFVPFLNKDDGVLLNAFKDWAGIDGDDARQMLEEYVDHIKQSLEKRGLYIIEGIGVLKYDVNGSLYLAKEGDTKRVYDEAAEALKKQTPAEETTSPKPEIQKTEPLQTELPKEEPAPKPTPSSVIEELAETVRQINTTAPVAPEVAATTPVTQESPAVQKPEPSVVPEPQLAPQPAVEELYGTGLNSRFAQQDNTPFQPEQREIPVVTPQQQPLPQPSEEATQPVERPRVIPSQQTYRTITPQPQGQPQRRPGNVGAVYFSSNDSTVNEPQSAAQIPPVEELQQPAAQPNPNNGFRSVVPPQPQQRPMTAQQRNSALYGTGTQPERRQPQTPPSPQGGAYRSGQQAATEPRIQPVVQRKRPVPYQQSKENSTSTKLVWVLAIVAIVLTIAVMVYAFIYSEDIELYDEINVEQTVDTMPSDTLSMNL